MELTAHRTAFRRLACSVDPGKGHVLEASHEMNRSWNILNMHLDPPAFPPFFGRSDFMHFTGGEFGMTVRENGPIPVRLGS